MFLRVGKRLVVAGWVVLQVSCATMSPEECKLARWNEVGQRDGLRGAPLSVLGDRLEDCAKVNVVVDTQAYSQGRDLGLQSYCRIENAVPLGLSGGSYAGVCPPAIDVVFQQRYQVAHAVYALRNEVKNLDDRTESLERQLRDINRSEDERLRGAGSDAERSKIHKDIDSQRQNIRNELAETDRRLHRRRDDLRNAEFDLSNLR
ncbi:DUF2799 domain-containing protein [Rhodoferax sp. GW822-FHT02A01]|uniref:DUF2799 domain-containing protein n=1 Tax=Rhodoferax sp. GW822-FHT02A01 TaxID=3141537 RepID=UPI00315D99A2